MFAACLLTALYCTAAVLHSWFLQIAQRARKTSMNAIISADNDSSDSEGMVPQPPKKSAWFCLSCQTPNWGWQGACMHCKISKSGDGGVMAGATCKDVDSPDTSDVESELPIRRPAPGPPVPRVRVSEPAVQVHTTSCAPPRPPLTPTPMDEGEREDPPRASGFGSSQHTRQLGEVTRASQHVPRRGGLQPICFRTHTTGHHHQLPPIEFTI